MASTTVKKMLLTVGENTEKRTVITTEGYSNCNVSDSRRAQRRLVFTLNGEGSPLGAIAPPSEPPPNAATVLAKSVASAPMTGVAGSYYYFSLVVPSGATNLQINTTGGTGDDDFYVKRDVEPNSTGNACSWNATDYTWKGATGATNESLFLPTLTPGTYYITVAACGPISDIRLTATYTDAPPPVGATILSNGVAVNNLSGIENSNALFELAVPAGASNLRFVTYGGSGGDVDIYTKWNAFPTTAAYDVKSNGPTTAETITVATPQVGTYYLLTHGAWSTYTGVSLVGSFDMADATAPTVPTGLTATAVSSSQVNLSWNASTDAVGVTGYKIFRGGVQIATAAGTTYNNTGLTASTPYSYTVAAYDAAGNTSAQTAAANATTQAGGPVVTALTNGVASAPVSGAKGSYSYYSIVVPAGTTNLQINTVGGTGDHDFYAKLGSQPTVAADGCSGANWTWSGATIAAGATPESVSIANPAAGTYYISVAACSALTNVTVTATYTSVPAAPPTVNALGSGVASGAMTIGAGNYRYFSIVVPAGTTNLQINTTGGTGDDDFYVKIGSQPISTNTVCSWNAADWTWKAATAAVNESLSIANPAAGTYYVSVAACAALTNITVTATRTP